MNVFSKVTLQSMKKSRTRTIVTIIGVVLSAALITAVTAFGVSLMNYMSNGAAAKYGGWHVSFSDVSSTFAEEQASDDRVSDTAGFQNIGYAKLDGGENPDKPYLFIAGFNEDAFTSLPVNLISGRMPEDSSEILVSGSVAANAGVKLAVGDTISLTVGNRMLNQKKLSQNDAFLSGKETFMTKEERSYTIVGICQRPGFEETFAPGYTLITKADDQAEADSISLFVTLRNPRAIRSYINSTVQDSGYSLNDNVLRFMGLSEDKLFQTLLYAVGAIVLAIIMIGSIFLIYNSFNISLNERTHQFGILSSVGATSRQLRNSVLFEGLCIGAVGIPIGIMIGIGSISLVLSIVARNFTDILYDDVPLSLTISPSVLVGAAAVSLITIIISAYIPARKTANAPVMESIRQTNEIKTDPKAMKTSKSAMRIYGLEGTLALKNFNRNKKRYWSIVLSLVLSVVLFISANSFVMYMKQAAGQTNEFTTYDVAFATQDMNDREMLELYDILKNADGVYESNYQALMSFTCGVHADDFSDDFREQSGLQGTEQTLNIPVMIQFLDNTTYQEMLDDLDFSIEEYTGENAKMIAVAQIRDMGTQKTQDNKRSDMFVDSNADVTIFSDAGKKQQATLEFVDIVPHDTPPTLEKTVQDSYFFRVMLPYSQKEILSSASSGNLIVKGLTFRSTNPKASADEMEKMITAAGITDEYSLYNVHKILDENRNIMFVVNVFAYTFILMISLIAAANVFNTISTNIKLRRRELAMLRSVGMADRDFNKMMRFECAFYGMRALMIGLPISLVSSWLVYKGISIGGAEGIDFVLPWASIGISVFSVLFVVFITMMYAVSKIKKENIIDALRDDMT